MGFSPRSKGLERNVSRSDTGIAIGRAVFQIYVHITRFLCRDATPLAVAQTVD